MFYLFICLYICTFMYIYIYIHTAKLFYLYMYIWIGVYMYICITSCVRYRENGLYIYIYMCIYREICMCLSIYTHIHPNGKWIQTSWFNMEMGGTPHPNSFPMTPVGSGCTYAGYVPDLSGHGNS